MTSVLEVTLSGFEAEFEAKLDSFFCHEPRSISSGVAVFLAGEAVGSETGDNVCDCTFSWWSGTFFFEVVAPLQQGVFRRKLHEQYQSASTVQAQTGTGTQTGTSVLSVSAR